MSKALEIDVIHASSGTKIATLGSLKADSTIFEVKKLLQSSLRGGKRDVNRISLRLQPKDKMLENDAVLNQLGLKDGARLFYKDLGMQIGWRDVFVVEYLGPLVIYGTTYLRPSLIYGAQASTAEQQPVVQLAFALFMFHFLKREYETLFVHRFSHGTMPIRNLFKNCSYYWFFAGLIGYYVNHPLYTAPVCQTQIALGTGLFLFGQLGTGSVHILLRNLRPTAASKQRAVPMPTSNPFTWLFNLVSCPNYTYELIAWAGFTVLTQTVASGLFTIAGAYQMTVWALQKHRNYRSDFRDYPKRRKAIFPFVL